MAPIKILAVADTHVDDRVTLAGLSPTDPTTGEPLVLTQARRMLRWVGEVARRERVDLILHAGDVYERPRPSPASEAVFAAAVDDWCAVAPVVVLLGNHDRPHGTDAHALEPLKGRRPGRLHIADSPQSFGVGIVVVFPVPYPSRSYLAEQAGGVEETNAAVSHALDRLVLAHAATARTLQVPTVLLGHGTLRGAAYREYQTVPLTDVQIRTEGFDAFGASVWGHLHKRQAAPGFAGRVHGYVGSPDRHDFGEEDEDKGVTLFELDPEGGPTSWRFEPYPYARTFLTLTADRFEDGSVRSTEAPDAITGAPILRVTGEVDEARYDRIAARARALKAGGVLIRNDCTVVRADRARVADVQTELGMHGALTAACQSRPDLAPHTEAILARAAGLRGAAL